MGRHRARFIIHAVLMASAALVPWGLPARASAANDPIEVDVRGDTTPALPRESSVAGGVIREERLRSPGLQAADVLRTQPGIAVVDTGGYGALSTVSIRGATAAQTPVYLAGVRINDDVGGNADLSLVPLWFVRRIDVYRSNAPLAGDRVGIGGAIFFEPRVPRKTEAGGGLMTGSFGARALWAHAGVGNADASALVAVRRDVARNDYTYLNDNGTRFDAANDHVGRFVNADVQTLDAWAVGNARLGDKGQVSLVANGISREQGLPGFALFPSTAARARFDRQLGAMATTVSCGTTCGVSTATSVIATQSRYEDPLNEARFGAAAMDFDATRVDSGLFVTLGVGRRITLTPSVRASVERLKLTATDAPTAHAQRNASRVALQGQWHLSDRLAIRALGTGECDGTSLQGRSPTAVYGDSDGPAAGSPTCHQFEPSARIGVELGDRAFTVLANFGRYARVPTLTELYGLSGAVRGNTALVPEVGLSAELGFRAAAPASSSLRGAWIDVFAFARDVRHLVAFRRATSGYVQPYNIGSARVLGVEVLAHYTPAPFALFEIATTLLDPRSTAEHGLTNRILPYQQRMIVTPRVELRSKFRGPVSSARLSSSCQLTSSRYGDAAGLIVIPAQRAWEADVDVGLFSDRIAVRARVANLLNETHFDLVGYPLPGRAAYVAMEAQW